MFYLGVDVSKKKLDCMLLNSTNGKLKSKSLSNTKAGIEELIEWLAENKAPEAHVIMEPTGVYHEPAALGACQIFCVKRGHEIIPKGLFHDRSDDHQKAQEAESCIPIPC